MWPWYVDLVTGHHGRWPYADETGSMEQVPLLAFNVGIFILDLKYGGNRHIWDIPLPLAPTAFQLLFTLQILYAVTSPLIKSSLCWFFRRLLGNSNRRFLKWFITITDLLIIGLGISYVFTVVFQCRCVIVHRPLALRHR